MHPPPNKDHMLPSKISMPGMGYICGVIGRKSQMESPKHQRLLPHL